MHGECARSLCALQLQWCDTLVSTVFAVTVMVASDV